MNKRRLVSALIVSALLVASAGSSQNVPGSPMRIVLLVDSSSRMGPMLVQFRAALNEFLNDLPGDPEMLLVSSGGQFRLRVPPTTERDKMRAGVGLFSSDGGGNALVDTMLEADKRFLKSVPQRRPVFVILTTDPGLASSGPQINDYNRFLHDFVERGGRAHAIVVREINRGWTTEILVNLTENTGGFFDTVLVASALPDRMKALVDLLAADQ